MRHRHDVLLVKLYEVLLTGEGVSYRHADTAEFDSVLNMERRIREVARAAESDWRPWHGPRQER